MVFVEYEITTRVRQRYVLTPVLFSLFFDAVFAATISVRPGFGRRMVYSLDVPLVGSRRMLRDEISISDLEYVDDMNLVSVSIDGLAGGMEGVQWFVCGYGAVYRCKEGNILAVQCQIYFKGFIGGSCPSPWCTHHILHCTLFIIVLEPTCHPIKFLDLPLLYVLSIHAMHLLWQSSWEEE